MHTNPDRGVESRHAIACDGDLDAMPKGHRGRILDEAGVAPGRSELQFRLSIPAARAVLRTHSQTGMAFMDHAALTVQLLGLVELPETPDGFDSGEVVRDAMTEIERLTRIDPGDTE